MLQWPRRVAEAVGGLTSEGRTPPLAPTPRTTIHREGSLRLYRFQPAGPETGHKPVLIVPSLINRWYIVDLRPGASLVAALLAAGHRVYAVDWGVPGDEDRYLGWDDVNRRLARAVRKTCRDADAASLALVGYCMGGTLAAIHSALWPQRVAALVNLAGPIDFGASGTLGRMVDPRWFDADAVADAGNVSPLQMQAGFVALKPVQQVSKWVRLADRGHDPQFRDAFAALEAWAGDNIPFPAAAYRTYIGDLYQRNALVAGTHVVGGRAVALDRVACPILTIVASADHICPPASARALNELAASRDSEVREVAGGHIGAVVGSRATGELYPLVAAWLLDRTHVEQ